MNSQKFVRVLCVILTLFLLSSFLPVFSVTALTVPYTPSEVYRSSAYYKKLCDVKLTGNYRKDIVAVAKSQVGYHEGNNESELHGGNGSGSDNYTEFGSWYGLQSDWCAMFICWCANCAGIPQGVIGRTGWADAADFGVEYRPKNSYTPVPGDIIVFDFAPYRTYTGAEDPDEFGDHVGIVVEVSGNTVKTVEGNSSNAVREKSYALTYSEIKGYGVYPDHPYSPDAPKTSKWYKQSEYYKKLQAVKKTGNYHEDLASVALSQVGYHEGDYVYQQTGTYTNGKGNYTEYGYWHGQQTAWSGIFVSWCANRAGIPESVLTPTVWSVTDDLGLEFKWAKDHTPAVGDVVIFDDQPYHADTEHPGAHGDRCGIVVAVSGNNVTVVEGASSCAVAKKTYSLSDPSIKGYGLYDEPKKEESSEPESSEPESSEPAESSVSSEPATESSAPETSSEEPEPSSEEPAESSEEPAPSSEEPVVSSEEPVESSEEPATSLPESSSPEEPSEDPASSESAPVASEEYETKPASKFPVIPVVIGAVLVLAAAVAAVFIVKKRNRK